MIHSSKFVKTEEFKISNIEAEREIESLKLQGFIFGQISIIGSKRQIKIELTNGKSLMICPATKAARIGNKVTKYKNLTNFIKTNKIEVKKWANE